VGLAPLTESRTFAAGRRKRRVPKGPASEVPRYEPLWRNPEKGGCGHDTSKRPGTNQAAWEVQLVTVAMRYHPLKPRENRGRLYDDTRPKRNGRQGKPQAKKPQTQQTGESKERFGGMEGGRSGKVGLLRGWRRKVQTVLEWLQPVKAGGRTWVSANQPQPKKVVPITAALFGGARITAHSR